MRALVVFLLVAGCTDEADRIREYKQLIANAPKPDPPRAQPPAGLPAHRFNGPALLGHGRAAARKELGPTEDPDQWKVGSTMLFLIYDKGKCVRLGVSFTDLVRGVAADHRGEIESWLSLESDDWRSRVTWDDRLRNLVTVSLKGHEVGE